MSRDTCSNWDRDWGGCGRCAGCLAEKNQDDTRERLERIEQKLDDIIAAQTHARAQA